MKDIFKYIISGLIAVAIFYFVTRLMDQNREKEQLIAQTALIEKEINNVSKLVVTEMKYEINAEDKNITIKQIPKPEVIIDPNLTFYKMDNGLLNRFEGKDYNTITRKVKSDLKKKIEKDQLIKNAQNRLVTELSNIYILSNSMGWKLVYNDKQVNSSSEINTFLFQSILPLFYVLQQLYRILPPVTDNTC